MGLSSGVLISVFVFLAVTLTVSLVALAMRGSDTKGAERLDVLIGRRTHDPSTDILKKTAFEGDKKSLLEAITPNIPSLQKIFEQAECNIKVSTIFGIGIGLGVVCGTLSFLALGKLWFFAPVVGLITFFLPFGWVLNKRRARLKRFGAQLPDALELVARALRAGHSLAAGMHVVAEEMPPPVSAEFGRVYEEQNLGIPIEDSLRGICERVPNLDLRFFVTSVAIQRQTGGDLAEILNKIGYVIRERFRILGQVQALTAEGRLSGVVLIALPPVLFLTMLHIQPEYEEALWTDPLGVKMLVGGIILQVLGAIVIKKIIDIKV
jgi:tight adherence protein B